ncbi:MAG: plastocyanin/azurin family copper-binding protein [Patescibacteria group bacterium]|jgi:plastocyanin
MKKIISLAALTVIVLVIGGCGAAKTAQTNQPTQPTQPGVVGLPSTGSDPAAASAPVPVPVAVDISNFSFSPSLLNIKPGTTVTWTNSDVVSHQIKSTAFNSDNLNEGQSFSYTFSNTGIFEYSCSIHPTMTGKIIVQ